MISPLDTPAGLLLVQLAVILALCRALGALARRLRQPVVVAEIGAGIVLGPSVLGAISPASMNALFPRDSLDTLHALSQLALVLFMFLVGLRLDAGQLFRTARTSLVVSQSSMLVPFVLGALMASWLYRELSTPDVPFTIFVLFVGLTMSVTALPVLARLLRERRLLDTRIGVVAVASAAIDDVVAWCLLGVVVSLVRSADVTGALFSIALVGVGVLALFGLRPVLARAGTRLLARSGMTDRVVGGVLVLLLAAGVLTESLGIHALFGAFVLGAISPREGGISRALADRLEDLTMLLLLPLFFAYSGLRTDVALLDDGRVWLIGAAVLLVGSVGKIGGGAIGARLSGLSWREAATVGVLVNMRGLMLLVVINIGLDLGIFSPSLFAILVLMTLATTAVTAPLLRVLQPSDIGLRKTLEVPWSPTPSHSPTMLCVPDARGAPAMALISHALGRADVETTVYGLKLDPPPDGSSTSANQTDRDGLDVLVERVALLGSTVRPLSFVSTHPGEDICRTAEVKGADFVLLGSQHPLDGAQVTDATALHVLRSSTSMVGVLVAPDLDELERAFVARGPDEEAALGVASQIAGRAGIALEHFDPLTGEPRRTDALGSSELVIVAVDADGRMSPQAASAAAEAASLLLVRGARAAASPPPDPAEALS